MHRPLAPLRATQNPDAKPGIRSLNRLKQPIDIRPVLTVQVASGEDHEDPFRSRSQDRVRPVRIREPGGRVPDATPCPVNILEELALIEFLPRPIEGNIHPADLFFFRPNRPIPSPRSLLFHSCARLSIGLPTTLQT